MGRSDALRFARPAFLCPYPGTSLSTAAGARYRYPGAGKGNDAHAVPGLIPGAGAISGSSASASDHPGDHSRAGVPAHAPSYPDSPGCKGHHNARSHAHYYAHAYTYSGARSTRPNACSDPRPDARSH